MFRSKLIVSLLIIILVPCLTTVESKCSKGCDLALGSYVATPGVNVATLSPIFNISVNDIMNYNTDNITNPLFVLTGHRIKVPFTCDCIDGEFLGHVFPYSVQSGDTYDKIAETDFASLTTAAMLARFNSYRPPLTENAVVNVTVNCSCGNASVSEAYGLFITYPLRVEDSLESIAAAEGVSGDLLQRFNPGANFSAGSGLVFIPAGGTDSSFFVSKPDSSFFVSKPGCPLKCGNVTVPYPFGIGSDCSISPWFNITCDTSSYPQKPYIGDNTFEVLFISQTQVWTPIHFFYQCYNQSGGLTTYNGLKSGLDYISFPFSISHTANKVTAVGCNDLAVLRASDTQGSLGQIGGCLPSCWGSVNFTTNCNGIGCCQSDIPKGPQVVGLDIVTVGNHSETWIYSHCTYAFIGEQDSFQFLGASDLLDPSLPNRTMDSVSMVLDFVIGNQSCVEAQKSNAYLCQQNTACIDSNIGGYEGYICSCKIGYEGNPYLSPGCTDIDECEDPKKHKCKDNAICNNTPGSYTCTGQGLLSSSSPLLLGVGIATIVLVLIALGFWLYRHFERRKKIRIKQKFFKRNGGLLFQQQVSSSEGSVMKTKLFEAQELEKATDNFNRSRVLGKGGLGTVYKGMLQDGSIVAVKKSNMINENQVGQFINEVSILLQIDHRNIVKLLGCCLEIEVPLLEYEYVSNGTLSHHLHDEGCVSTMSWENRLRIAKEVAGALAYLHSYASTSIFHRDIKSANILLDENFRAVVSDFGLSRSVSIEKTHLTTVVGGTFGYLDPEYFRSGQFTDKSDVYAFGVVLAELLTGVKAVSLDVSKLGLVMYLQSSMKQNRLFEILDPLVVKEGLKEDILVVAKLAKRCLKLNAKKRPSMREVAADLDRLVGKQIQPSHGLICREKYLSESESFYSYATDGISEDCSNRSLVFPNHTA